MEMHEIVRNLCLLISNFILLRQGIIVLLKAGPYADSQKGDARFRQRTRGVYEVHYLGESGGMSPFLIFGAKSETKAQEFRIQIKD